MVKAVAEVAPEVEWVVDAAEAEVEAWEDPIKRCHHLQEMRLQIRTRLTRQLLTRAVKGP